MESRLISLFSYELEALLEALRRDLRAERCKAMTDTENASYHLANYRSTIKVLEILNPKRARQQEASKTDARCTGKLAGSHEFMRRQVEVGS